METRYILALAVLFGWILLRVFFMLQRRSAKIRWRKQEEANAQEKEPDTAPNLHDDE